MSRRFVRSSFLILALYLSVLPTKATVDTAESRRLVAMRTIGHEILLLSGDSTSRVMPIEKKQGRYEIQFESDFDFDPDLVIARIDEIVKRDHIAEEYLVEFAACPTDEVVYSYAFEMQKNPDEIACRSRLQPIGCYRVYFTILTDVPLVGAQLSEKGNSEGTLFGSLFDSALPIFGLLFVLGLGWIWRKRIATNETVSDTISIGQYRFDKHNMILLLNQERIELTSKEAELLTLLHSGANSTVERSVILKTVWGDEGDYIGRTLDVFVSKLRKKLEADPEVRIANIRGVGYRLVC